MKRVIAVLMLIVLMLLVGCNTQPSNQVVTTGDTGEFGLLDTSGQQSDDTSHVENLSGSGDTGAPETTVPDTTVPETTVPEVTEPGQSDWHETETESPTEAPTEPETTAPVPTDPATTDTETIEQTINASTETSCTEPDTTPIEDGQPNTDAGWGPIV